VVGIESPGRRSLLDGASNFRDLGGYSTVDERVVRVGMVFRSGRSARFD
jgi:protein-tyrosine phosphatase